jgi:hypothetical protein
LSPNSEKNLALLVEVASLSVVIFSDASLPIGVAVIAATGAATCLVLVLARRSDRLDAGWPLCPADIAAISLR